MLAMYEDIPMNEVELRIRAWLSPEAVKDFDDMYYCRVLGAGNNIRLIGKMYADLSATAKKSCWKASELIDRVEVINEYFIKKRDVYKRQVFVFNIGAEINCYIHINVVADICSSTAED